MIFQESLTSKLHFPSCGLSPTLNEIPGGGSHLEPQCEVVQAEEKLTLNFRETRVCQMKL